MTDNLHRIQAGELLWQPSEEGVLNSNIVHYMLWLAKHKQLYFDTYAELWRWSVDDIGGFWESLWDYFDLKYSQRWTTPIAERTMPGAQWFTGARLNYAENIFSRMTDERPMLLYMAEDQVLVEYRWQTIYDQTKRLAHALRGMGVQAGDRVVAYMPNCPETLVALLAVASLGAVWSACSPEFGTNSVLDRFSQIEPKVMLAVDGYRYGGKAFDRRAVVSDIQAAIPSLEHTILVPHLNGDARLPQTHLWADVLAASEPEKTLSFEQVPFDHPLWVVYSSGTTGLPKPIVHGHGGILLEHAKSTVFHNDLKAGDRFFWYTSTGWMMWNYLVGSLLSGATIIQYNGSPFYPDANVLFNLAAQSGMTYFGMSSAFVSACIKAGIHPNQTFDLSHIRAAGATGSPLTVEGFNWVYDNINPTLALESLSGGTDLCTPLVGGVRIQPIYAGEIQGAALGAKVQAFNEAGQPIVDEVGELVITEPMPSMPLYFWNDPEMKRYRDSYFDVFPNVWRHGDWIQFNARGGCIIYGRSDSTINRQGIRMGTSEIYRVVELLDVVADSLIIDLELLGRESRLILFVVLQAGRVLDSVVEQAIKQQVRRELSPRHVPDDVVQINAVPYTLSGKKIEVPIRKILLGMDVDTSANRGSMRNPEALDFFIDYGKQLSNS